MFSMCVSGEDSKLLFTNSAAKSAESTFLIEPNASSNASSLSDNLAISFQYNLMFLFQRPCLRRNYPPR